MSTWDASGFDDVLEWLARKERLLVISHERPDGDAYGSVFGMVNLLSETGRKCDGYMQRPVPRRYELFLPRIPSMLSCNDGVDVGQYDGVICLDTTDIERAAIPADWNTLPRSICNIDHHPDNKGYGEAVWLAPEMGATAQMLSIMVRQAFDVDAVTATCFLAGILADTGALRFSNTTSSVLRECATLMDMGADYAGIVDAMFFHEEYGRKKLEAHLLTNARTAHNHRLMYSVLRPEDFERYSVSPEDTEGLIDCLRTIDGVEVACLLQPGDDAVRFSFRSCSRQKPVNEVARKLNGGGHPLAAGARVEGVSLEEAEEKLIALTRDLIES